MYHNGIGVDRFLVPDTLVDLIRGKYSARVLDQELHDLEFHRSQLHCFSVHRHFHGFFVQFQSTDGIHMGFFLFFPTDCRQIFGISAQMGIHPRQQLQRRGGQHDHRELVILLPQLH